MNERIQKLMKQSMVEYQFDLRFSPEKFAELIVRECMDVVSRKCASPTAYDALVEHFGVEE